MRIAVVHYHLAKGGVTRVIEAALNALRDSDHEVLVLSSTAAEGAIEPVKQIPELAYNTDASLADADQLERQLLEKATEHFGQPPDVWHFHNHGLGKNVNLPEVIRRFALRGERMILQIHDFAEDGRPNNFSAQTTPYRAGTFQQPDLALYPIAPQIVYAVLNSRDLAILLKAGIPQEQLLWLPNAIDVPDFKASSETLSGDLILYPTRGIRRKNVGELLLMAALQKNFRFATTLIPRNPQWLDIHKFWDDLAKDLKLPVTLGLGENPEYSFESLINEARSLVTTSVAEGFGLAFLEPALFGKPLLGRNLPEITQDFTQNGIRLPGLYSEWPIPLQSFDTEALKSRFNGALHALYAAYGRQNTETTAKAWKEVTKDGFIDFARLDEPAQAEVIHAVSKDRSASIRLPFSFQDEDPITIQENKKLIRSLYGIPQYREKLVSLYQRVCEAIPQSPEAAPVAKVLDGFLDPNRFSLLRS